MSLTVQLRHCIPYVTFIIYCYQKDFIIDAVQICFSLTKLLKFPQSMVVFCPN